MARPFTNAIQININLSNTLNFYYAFAVQQIIPYIGKSCMRVSLWEMCVFFRVRYLMILCGGGPMRSSKFLFFRSIHHRLISTNRGDCAHMAKMLYDQLWQRQVDFVSHAINWVRALVNKKKLRRKSRKQTGYFLFAVITGGHGNDARRKKLHSSYMCRVSEQKQLWRRCANAISMLNR